MPLFQMFLKLGLVNTHWPLILVPIFGAPSVFATFVMRQFFIALPVELEEAARVDGLGRFKIFWTHRAAAGAAGARPRSRSSPSCTAGTSTSSRSCSSPRPSKFTLPQALTQYVDAYGGPMWNIQLAAATLTALPVLIVFVLAQQQFVEGLAHTGLKG